MTILRALLAVGNGKLGGSIHHFDLPAIETCPGSTEACRGACYARPDRGNFRHRGVRERLRWCYQQSLLPDFHVRAARELRARGVVVHRLHVSGDFYDAEYAQKWLWVMRRTPKVRHYFYTRSWRVPEVEEVLARMAGLANVRAWYSLDRETGTPARVPPGVALAYMQADEWDDPGDADLVFRVRRLRRQPAVGLPVVCPHETPRGKATDVNCGNCQHCWR